MVVFIGNLPSQATVADLSELGRLPAGSHLRIIKKRKKDRDGELVRFGLLQTASPKQARKLIARYNGKQCLGAQLTAREYEPRVAGNERRRLDWRQLHWAGDERRQDERRSMLAQHEPMLQAASAA
jgi:hypothetical protein